MNLIMCKIGIGVQILASALFVLGSLCCGKNDGSELADDEHKRNKPVAESHRPEIDPPIPPAVLRERAAGFSTSSTNDEAFSAFVEDLKHSIKRNGNYEEIVEVIQVLPGEMWLPVLLEFVGTSSPLAIQDELNGKLFMIRSLAGIDDHRNGITPMFFEGSSEHLPELRRLGLESGEPTEFLVPMYFDLAQANPRSALSQLEKDNSLWDTVTATDIVVEELMRSDPLGASQSIASLEKGPLKDRALATLLQWMRANNESHGVST